MTRRHVIVHGTVQGVFFRASCQQEAARVGVAGWVTNWPDGSVEAVFEGSAADVDHMVTWCRSGPPRAAVADVEVSDRRASGRVRLRGALILALGAVTAFPCTCKQLGTFGPFLASPIPDTVEHTF